MTCGPIKLSLSFTSTRSRGRVGVRADRYSRRVHSVLSASRKRTRALVVVALVVVALERGALASPARADSSWTLLGASGWPVLVEPVGGRRSLVCTPEHCDVWDMATGTSTATSPLPPMSSNDVVHTRLAGGDILAVDASRASRPHIWNVTSGRWQPAAALPVRLNGPRVGLLKDGRVVIVGDVFDGRRRALAYVADAAVRGWSLLTEAPSTIANPTIVPTPSGLLVLSGDASGLHLSRFAVADGRWRDTPLRDWPTADKRLQATWADDALFLAWRGDHWEALLVGPTKETRLTVPLPPMKDSDGLVVTRVRVADGSERLILETGRGRAVLWESPNEPPRDLPVHPLGWRDLPMVADGDRLLVPTNAGALTLLAPADQPAGKRACDGLERYLVRTFERQVFSQVFGDASDAIRMGLVSDACRQQVRRGEAPALIALLRGWTARTDWAELAWIFECAIEDPGVLPVIEKWIASKDQPRGRSVCLARLSTWPGADEARGKVFGNLIRHEKDRWWVEPALAAALYDSPPGSSLREWSTTALREAAGHHASGFDDLRRTLCTQTDDSRSSTRTQACAETASLSETSWRVSERPASGQDKPRSRAPVVIGATVVAGLIAGAYFGRTSDAGLAIATGAGALGGATLGLTLSGTLILGTASGGGKRPDDGALPLILSLSAITGGILGGIGAHAWAASPSARAPVTAGGLAFPFLVTMIVAFN